MKEKRFAIKEILEKIFRYQEFQRGGIGTRIDVYDIYDLLDKRGWRKKKREFESKIVYSKFDEPIKLKKGAILQ